MWIERQRKEREGLRDSQSFWFGESGELFLLGLRPERKVSWLLLGFSDEPGFHSNI